MPDTHRVAELARLHALAAAIASYEDEFGSFSDDELTGQFEADKRQMVRPQTK